MSEVVHDESVKPALVHTSDLDQLVEQVTTIMSRHTVTPARAGGFTADVSGIQTPGLSLLHMDYGMPLRLSADPLDDYVAVCLPLTGSMTARHQSRRIEAVAGRSALVGTPESELVMDWDEALRLLVLRIDLSALRSFAARLITTAPEQPDLRFDPAMEDPQIITTTALGQARMMQDLLAEAGPEQVNPLTAAHLREQVMFTLLLGQPNTWSPALRHRPERVRRSVISEAVELIRAHADEPLTIEGLARTVGLSVRALHAGFRRELDRSPKQYLQQVRLQRAHDDLTAAIPGAGITVIDVAHRWGSPTRAASPPSTASTTVTPPPTPSPAPREPDRLRTPTTDPGGPVRTRRSCGRRRFRPANTAETVSGPPRRVPTVAASPGSGLPGQAAGTSATVRSGGDMARTATVRSTPTTIGTAGDAWAIRVGTPTAHPDGGADQDRVRQLEDRVHGLSQALHSRDVIARPRAS